jgi:hypothetical protein
VKVDVVYSGETFWLTQKRMAELFGVAVPAISKHLKNIFETGELQENSVISKMETTAADGKNYTTAFYSLDAVIAVGYRVNSRQATQFRIWATERLKEYIIKGFTMDDERLKNMGGGGYWKELLQHHKHRCRLRTRMDRRYIPSPRPCASDVRVKGICRDAARHKRFFGGL